MIDNKLKFKKMAIEAARLADSKKAESIVVYDLAGRSELADYIVAVTVDSPPQLEAVDDEISIKMKQEGLYAMYRDGARSKNWKVLDYGGLIVHIFERQARLLYSLDKLFDGFKRLPWEVARPSAAPAAVKSVPAPKKTVKKPAVKKAVKKTAPKKAVKKPAARAKKAKPVKKTSKKK